jgi:hypothetical protein
MIESVGVTLVKEPEKGTFYISRTFLGRPPGLMKHFVLRVAAIDDMIAEVAYRGAGRAWHNPVYLGQCLNQEKRRMFPFSGAWLWNLCCLFMADEIS